MLNVLTLAMQGTLRKGRFFLHVAVIVALASVLQGGNWSAIFVRLVLIAVQIGFVFFFESYKAWRYVSGKPHLNQRQLWRCFFVSSSILFVAFVGAAICFSVFAGNPNGLALLSPFLLAFMVTFSVLLYWESKYLDVDGA
jgi:hypothetical protein